MDRAGLARRAENKHLSSGLAAQRHSETVQKKNRRQDMNNTPIETISKAIDALAALRQAMTLNRPIDEDMLQRGINSSMLAGVLCVDLKHGKIADLEHKVGT
jgi:hypothetical protein